MSFLATWASYALLAIAMRKFVPDDWRWNELKLEPYVWDEQVPIWIRRLYVLNSCLFFLAMICLAALAFIEGKFLGVILGVVVVGAVFYRMHHIWVLHHGDF